MQRKYLFQISIGLLLLAGCATTQVTDLYLYQEAPLENTDIMPDRRLLEEFGKSKKAKVIVLESESAAVRSRMSDAAAILSRKIEDVLEGTGVEIVDRNLGLKLKDEINLAISKGNGLKNYSGPFPAQFAVQGLVTNANVNRRFKEASRQCDKKTGQCEDIPASCTYVGEASGMMRVYEVPALRLIRSFPLTGTEIRATEGYCRSDRNTDDALLRKSIENLVQSSRAEIQNTFAPKGYVIEKRVNGDKVIIKVMAGKLHGIKSQDKLTFYKIRESQNRLTNETTREEIPIMTGTVSDQITDDYAWIVPDDLEKSKMIRLGDFVKVTYTTGFFENMNGFFNAISK